MLPCRLREFSLARQNLCETRTQKLETVVAPQSAKPKVLSIPFAIVFCCKLLNLNQIDIQPFGGFTPRTMSFYKYGRKKFFLPYGVAFGPFGSRRLRTISGDWNLLSR